jgi:hypothetical protein
LALRRSPSSSSAKAPLGEDELARQRRRIKHAFAAILVGLSPAAILEACNGNEVVTPVSQLAGDSGPDTHADVHDGGSSDGDANAKHDGESPHGDADAMSLEDADGGSEDGDAMDMDADAMSDGPLTCAPLVSLGDAGPDGDVHCLYDLPCGLPDSLWAIGCEVYGGPDGGAPIGCRLVNGEGCQADAYSPPANGEVTMDCNDCFGGGGRRPRGLRRSEVRASSSLGVYFAKMAYDEAASVRAFERMQRELAAHDAPEALVRAAGRAVRDEVRHARLMTSRAEAHGAVVPSPRVRRAKTRSLEAIAKENAVEGCVHETFGALLLAWQAKHAPRASFRRAFARIAADEARHAALSWAVAQWLEGRLDARARARVEAARARAVRSLGRSGAAIRVDGVGFPGRALRAAIAEAFAERVVRIAA